MPRFGTPQVAIDLFRADDAHPLLAPFASTMVTWVLAFKVLLDGGPTGIPRDIGLWMMFLGPATITIINIWACRRLWRKYHSLLFRDGPRKFIDPGTRDRASRSRAA